MVFSEQYKYNTLKNEVSFGIGRFRVYASRWVVSLLVLAALYLVLVLVYALSSLILLGLPSQADAQAMYGVDAGRVSSTPSGLWASTPWGLFPCGWGACPCLWPAIS